MRNDVSFPPPPGDPTPPDPRSKPAVGGRSAMTPRSPLATHPHHADRAHSLNKTSDRAATGMIYETPEDRGGIDSTTLSIVVVAVVAIVLLIVGWLTFGRAGDVTPVPTETAPPGSAGYVEPSPEVAPAAVPVEAPVEAPAP